MQARQQACVRSGGVYDSLTIVDKLEGTGTDLNPGRMPVGQERLDLDWELQEKGVVVSRPDSNTDLKGECKQTFCQIGRK